MATGTEGAQVLPFPTLLTRSIRTGEQPISHLGEHAGEQLGEQVLTRAQPALLTREQMAEMQPLSLLTREQNPVLTREQSKEVSTLLTREQTQVRTPACSPVSDTEWLKSICPPVAGEQSGWWDAEANGKGFKLKFRWRAKGQQTLTLPRISREMFDTLKEQYDAKWYLADWIAGALDDLADGQRADKARTVAARLGFTH